MGTHAAASKEGHPNAKGKGVGMATQDLQSVVSVQTYANGNADVMVTGKGGTLTLNVSPDGPTIAVKDPERGPYKYKVQGGLRPQRQRASQRLARQARGRRPGQGIYRLFPGTKATRQETSTAEAQYETLTRAAAGAARCGGVGNTVHSSS
jgi:hypothetical protein